jgi:protein ImuA
MPAHSSALPAALARRVLQDGLSPANGTLAFLPGLSIAAARVHELCGPSRHMLALTTGGAMSGGPAVWIRSGRAADRLHPEGILPLFDPQRLILVTPQAEAGLLAAAEDALRSGAIALVVVELSAPPALTPLRRLQLAAAAGAAAGPAQPTGLVLTPGAGGAPGVETRWHIAPRLVPRKAGEAASWPGQGGGEWDLTRAYARGLPPAAWRLARDAATGFVLCPPQGDPSAADAPSPPQPAYAFRIADHDHAEMTDAASAGV